MLRLFPYRRLQGVGVRLLARMRVVMMLLPLTVELVVI